ncbi:MAG: protein phosphatase 2C domain-containing protein [Woeseiaceae bacterium]|nr:protein phosphatase 2C domain-containing protein [Woeseiaceae bacterium]
MSNAEMAILDGASAPDRLTLSLAGGTMIAYTSRAPDKDTDNEDTVGAMAYGDDAAVMMVADGAGGLPGGKRASVTAVAELERSLTRSLDDNTALRTAILDGIEAANQAVRDIGNGSATTLTVVAVEGMTARSYQIGDSEALVVGQRGRVRAQTMAHSPTGFAVEAGFLDQREALHHAERHLVSNYLGSADMRIDMGGTIDLHARDTILLATDGLTDNIHLHEIIELIRKGPLGKSVDALTNLAARRMTNESRTMPSKPDDLSLILFRRPPPAKSAQSAAQA